MDEHAISCLPLAAVARHRIAVVEMPILSNVESDGATGVETDSEVASLLDLFDCAQFTVGDMLLSIRCGELYAVAFTETRAPPPGRVSRLANGEGRKSDVAGSPVPR